MLTVNKLTVQFGARTLFRDLSFSVGAKDRIAFAGPNGAGKSTLMKIIAGIDAPDAGTIATPKDLAVGYLPQEGIHIKPGSQHAHVVGAVLLHRGVVLDP